MAFKSAMDLFMTDSCYDKFFVDFNFLDVPCLKAVVSKVLGYSIIAGAVLVKVPQIQKITSAQSGQGVSFSSLLLEIYAVISMLTYSFVRGFPFSSWGDSFFLLFQNILIGFLIQKYSNRAAVGVLFTIFSIGMVFILGSGFTPISVLTALQASNLPAVIIAKLLQAIDNFKNGHTGQLSAVTVFLMFLGSVARIFTSIQETGDNLIILTYIVSSSANALIASQILWYWNAKSKTKEE